MLLVSVNVSERFEFAQTLERVPIGGVARDLDGMPLERHSTSSMVMQPRLRSCGRWEPDSGEAHELDW
jgi:hypothetical protein